MLRKIKSRPSFIKNSVRLALSCATVAICAGQLQSSANAQQTAPSVDEMSIFNLPAINVSQTQLTLPVIRLFQQKKYVEAEKMLRGLIEKLPMWPVHHYNLGGALARQGKTEEAMDAIEKAISLGFSGRKTLLNDPDFAELKSFPRFRELSTRIGTPLAGPPNFFRRKTTPVAVRDGIAPVEPDNTSWISTSNVLVSGFVFSTKDIPARVTAENSKVPQILNKQFADGEIAGNNGDLYDNRDGGHSTLLPGAFPQVTEVRYGTAAKAAKINQGISAPIFFNTVTVGNSSTAINQKPYWRSQPRLIMTVPALSAIAFQQYANNHLYIYPEHRDHDPERGDLFPANTPYMLISQGSSGSDKPFIEAAFSILAAFTPEVKAFLRTNRLVMPTVQKILRSGMSKIATRNDYMSALAHPSVFQGKEVNLEKMVSLARQMKVENIPPRVDLVVEDESKLLLGADYFGPVNRNELLFTTPSAIARVMRSTAQKKTMLISAAGTKDPNGKPLTFHWKILRGDPAKITVKPMEKDGSKAQLEVSWQERGVVPFERMLTTDRVDIAVFADNGKELSAPAFISFYFPPNQSRTYTEDGRITEIRYDPPDLEKRYVDPAILFKRGWTDRYEYTDKGEVLGWVRTRKSDDGKVQRYTRHGIRIIEDDEKGRPIRGEGVNYQVVPSKDGPATIKEMPIGKFVRYTYESPTDMLGKVTLCKTEACEGS